VNLKAQYFEGTDLKEGEIPEDLKSEMDNYRSYIIEAAAETDDELLMKYLEGEELSPEEVREGLG